MAGASVTTAGASMTANRRLDDSGLARRFGDQTVGASVMVTDGSLTVKAQDRFEQAPAKTTSIVNRASASRHARVRSEGERDGSRNPRTPARQSRPPRAMRWSWQPEVEISIPAPASEE
jgi:hypothetical protein